jgi:hypothetical protein
MMSFAVVYTLQISNPCYGYFDSTYKGDPVSFVCSSTPKLTFQT